MTIQKPRLYMVAMLAGLVLAGCGGAGGGSSANAQRQAIFSCADEVGYDGLVTLSVSYESGSGTSVRMIPQSGASQSLADTINACADRKLAQTGAATPVSANALPKIFGKIPLPTEYPLLDGDAALWPTLTLEQQQRALLFLQDGSTIRSSLLGD